jgi:pyridoxal/pyridoxine/pyridoxamine kinase
VAHGHTAWAEDQEDEAGLMVVTQDELSCPISFQLMTDPVMADDGYTYQQHAIEAWINKCNQGKGSENQ